MKLFQPPETRVIVLEQGLLSEDQMTSALRVSENTMWWRALIQRIEAFRDEATQQAAASAGGNNPLAMAANCGAHTALTALLDDLETRRSSKG
jgi:hypothetical protein